MCQRHDSGEFTAFCLSLRARLSQWPYLDPALAAAVELLDRRASSVGWFECEATHVAFNTEDLHSMLGACVVLSLWNATKISRA